MIVLNDRILLEQGLSLVESDQAAKRIFETGKLPDHFRVAVDDEDVLENYRIMYQRDLSVTDDDLEPIEDADSTHTQEQEEAIIRALETSPRLKQEEVYLERIEHEMDFFYRTDNIVTVFHALELVQRFQEDKVVYGVGRGSSVASLVLYCLFIHDIDPIRFDIPFNEFSKE